MEIEKIASDVNTVIEESKVTSFAKKNNVEIPTDEALYELKASISNNVGMYFYKLIEKSKK